MYHKKKQNNMSKVILYIDLEGNCAEFNPEIIQIGAFLVCYNSLGDVLWDSGFCCYVKPLRNEPNSIAKKISGITSEETNKACTFPVVYHQLNHWILKTLFDKLYKNNCSNNNINYKDMFAIITPCSFSNCDFSILIKHLNDYHIKPVEWLTNGWADMRLLFAKAKCGGILHKLSLKSALEIAKVNVNRSGSTHDALEDAKLCASLYTSVKHLFYTTDKIINGKTINTTTSSSAATTYYAPMFTTAIR